MIQIPSCILSQCQILKWGRRRIGLSVEVRLDSRAARDDLKMHRQGWEKVPMGDSTSGKLFLSSNFACLLWLLLAPFYATASSAWTNRTSSSLPKDLYSSLSPLQRSVLWCSVDLYFLWVCIQSELYVIYSFKPWCCFLYSSNLEIDKSGPCFLSMHQSKAFTRPHPLNTRF